jgi:hypothetical protein
VNVNIKTEVTETTVITNDNCHVALVNGKITGIKVHRTSVVGLLEFENFAEFEGFVQGCVDTYHAVRLELINERRSAEGSDRSAGPIS